MNAFRRCVLGLMAFIVALASTLGLLTLVSGQTAVARGETYRWKDSSTFEITGGRLAHAVVLTKNREEGNKIIFNLTTADDQTGCKFSMLVTVPDKNKPEDIEVEGVLTDDKPLENCSAEIMQNDYGFVKTAVPNVFKLITKATETQNATAPPGGGPAAPANPAQPEARCELESLGWIICPILTISAKAITLLGNLLSRFLFTDPISIPTSTDLNTVAPEQQARVAAFVIWQNIRNLANVLFLLFFLFAIFSIATSMGMSNYNIKKILPRVIVAAILINLSYYIFAFAIDVTNILGRGVEQLFNVPIPSAAEPTAEPGDLGLYGIGAIAGLTGAAITGVLAAILLPFVAGVVVGIFLLLLLVLFREIAIVFFVVLSPLAAVLWILPNTENIAKKFTVTARNILLIYPFLMAAIAVSNLAAQLILAIGYENG